MVTQASNHNIKAELAWVIYLLLQFSSNPVAIQFTGMQSPNFFLAEDLNKSIAASCDCGNAVTIVDSEEFQPKAFTFCACCFPNNFTSISLRFAVLTVFQKHIDQLTQWTKYSIFSIAILNLLIFAVKSVLAYWVTMVTSNSSCQIYPRRWGAEEHRGRHYI